MNLSKLLKMGLFVEIQTGSSAYIYSNEPSNDMNDLDLTRLLEGREDFYRLPIPASTYKKKRIIIHDPSIALDLVTTIAQSAEMLFFMGNLIRMGFPVSVWANDQLIEIKNPADLLPALKLINKPTHPEDITNFLATRGIASKDCFLWGVQQSNSQFSKKNFSFIAFEKLIALTNLKSFLATLTLASPLDIKIHGSNMVRLDDNIKQSLIDFLDNNPVINFTTVDEQLYELLPFAKLIKKIDVSMYDYANYRNDISISEPVTEEQILQKWKNIFNTLKPYTILESIDLSKAGLNTIPDNFVWPKTLKTIKLPDFEIKSRNIVALFNDCPMLETLDLPNCQNVNELAYLSPCPSLKKLSLFHSDLTWLELGQILKSFPNIETLDLGGCQNLGSFPEHFSLPDTLKEISLFGTKTCWNDVLKLLKSNSSLENLDLNSCGNLGEFPDTISFPTALKTLILKYIIFDRRDFPKLLNYLPLLETLNLATTILTNDFVKMAPQYSLKELDLSDTQCSWNEINIFLQAFPSLERLILLSSWQLQNLPENLSFLSRIHLIETNPSHAARLKKLNPEIIVISKKHHHPKQLKSENDPQLKTKPKLDSDTGLSNRKIYMEEVFPGIHPCNYRKEVFTGINIDDSEISLEEAPLNLLPYSCVQPKGLGNIFSGVFKIKEYDTWIALPSLTASDLLLSSYCEPNAKRAIAYNPNNNQYYVYFPKQEIDLPIKLAYHIESNFARNIPVPELDENTKKMVQSLAYFAGGEIDFPEDEPDYSYYEDFCDLSYFEQLSALRIYFNHAKPQNIPPEKDAEVLLNTIIAENIGACRHRVQAFMAIAKEFSLPVRAIYNDVHAFIEVLNNGQWEKWDLGGFPANLELIKAPIITGSEQVVKPPALSPENPFKPWDTVSINASTMDEYAEKLMSHGDKLTPGKNNVLVTMKDTQISDFATAVLKQKKNKCFYLPDFNNVQKKQTVINNVVGGLQEEDSQLKKFLENAKPGDVLLVNWSLYRQEQIGYNSIIDTEQRKIRGMNIPDDIIVISILDNTRKMREDFYSRNRLVSDCPSTLTINSIMPTTGKITKSTEVINFYDDWHSVLCGEITASNGQFSISTSPLIEIIKSGQTEVVLRNAPWHLPEFSLFITKMRVQRELTINGQSFKIPENFLIHRDDTPYPLQNEKNKVEAYTPETALKDAYVLNSVCIKSLFKQFQSVQGKLNTIPGLIQQHEGKTLKLLVTQNLSDLQWAHINHVANFYNVSLHLITTPEIDIPGYPEIVSTDSLKNPFVKIIETNDIDFVCDEFSDEAIVIPVNEKTTLADLVGIPQIKKSGLDLSCDYQKSILTELLQSGKQVVLKGNLSDSLMQGLTSVFLDYLFINGTREENIKGTLTVVSNNNPCSSFVLIEKHGVTCDKCWNKLHKSYFNESTRLQAITESFFNRTKILFNYSELKTMLEHMKNYPDSNPLKTVLRARTNYTELKSSAEQAFLAIHPSEKVKVDKLVMEKREAKLEERLAHSWYVFVAGPTGTGKSTTILQAIRTLGYEPVTRAGTLKDKLRAWLEPGPARCLFIDEANLFEPGELDILEGLYTHPPKLLIDGIYYDVPKDNRLIFAGNFGHFEGRQELRFISRHGNIITFKEFTNDFLMNNIMRPLCSSLKMTEEETKNDVPIFLHFYHFINRTWPEKQITARNLQMMIMRNITAGNAVFSAFNEASGMLNQKERKHLAAWIKNQFNEDVKILKNASKEKVVETNILSQNYRLTKKRINPVRILQNLMDVRELRIKNPETVASGINGLIIEGNSGLGKSSLALEYVRSKGIPFYHIQAGDLEEIKKTLIRAFHEGACVIIDEMNTLPLEILLNSLLSGVTPEGVKADNPGFFVIGTQNSLQFGDRTAYSKAFLNRFQKLDLKDYAENDLNVITSMINNDPDKSKVLVNYFLESQDYAKYHHKLVPTPRDLFENAREAKNKL